MSWRFLLLLGWSLAWAEDARVESLRAMLVPMRDVRPAEGDKGRGAGPQFTAIKHELRDWVEGRLKGVEVEGNEQDLIRDLNKDLRDAGLLCGWGPTDTRCPDWFHLGYLSKLELRQKGRLLAHITGVGIECGFDESVYLFGHSSEGWRRVWQSEQNDYTEGQYKPQTIRSVQLSPYNRANDYLITSVGIVPWCSSTWHDVYYRVFRPGLDLEAKPLVDGAVFANVNSPPEGAITAQDALVEYTITRSDGNFRRAVRHYEISGDRAVLTDPLALSPRAFVEEWMDLAWKEAGGRWTEDARRKQLRDWHENGGKDARYAFPTMHCAAAPDLWQVQFEYDPPKKPVYFLVRWRPPYRFTMVGVSDRADARCREEDRDADDDRTLFPGR